MKIIGLNEFPIKKEEKKKIINLDEFPKKYNEEEGIKNGLIAIIVILCIIIGVLLMRNYEEANSRRRMDEIYREYFGDDAVDRLYEKLNRKALYRQLEDERYDPDMYDIWRP